MIQAASLASAAALALALAAPNRALAACSHITDIQNNSGITLRFSELKSAVSPPTIFKSQWTGSRVIASGATGTIKWTSDWSCTTSSGASNHWDIKLVRKDGTVHYCGDLSQSQAVKVTTPDLCFPN